MATQSVPACVEVLQIFSNELDQVPEVFQPGSPEFRRLKDVAASDTDIDTLPEFANSAPLVRYFQCLLLAALSMHGGIYVPVLRSITTEKEGVSLSWDSGVHNRFTWGKLTPDFIEYTDYYKIKIFQNQGHRGHLPSSIFTTFLNRFEFYLSELKVVENRLNRLLEKKKDVDGILSDDHNRDLLFILLSSMPADQINALFVYIHGFFPDDLTVKSEQGNEIKVGPVFQSPSTDLHYLIEKVKMYFRLYFSKDAPIIRHITQSKTQEYLKKLFSNDEVYRATFDTLDGILHAQVKSRQTLYQLLFDHLKKVLG